MEKHSFFVAKQPIFCPTGTVYGHELLFRHAASETAVIGDPLQATSQVIIDGLTLVGTKLQEPKKVFINIPYQFLQYELMDFLPANSCILEILEDTPSTPENLQKCKLLRGKGYTLALDDFSAQKHLLPFLDYVDIVKVDMRDVSKKKFAPLVKWLTKRKLLVLAEKVETHEEAQWAMEAGCALVQGFFYQRPKLLEGKRIPADVKTKLEILGMLSSPDYGIDDFIKIFSYSPQLSFKLLSFVNSPFFALEQELTSVRNTVYYLGLNKTRQWLCAFVIADGSMFSETTEELNWLSITRASFLSQIVPSEHKELSDKLFMLGLFSTLDAIYQYPFAELLKHVPLHEDIYRALSGNDGPLYAWLKGVMHLENNNMEAADKIFCSFGIQNTTELHKDYAHTLIQCREFFMHSA